MFQIRSYAPELLDIPHLPEQLLLKNLKELDTINQWLGGHRISIKGLERLLMHTTAKSLHVVDLGCGGGDGMKQMANWSRAKGLDIDFTGVDNNPQTVTYLKNNCIMYPEVHAILSDYKTFIKESKQPIDIIHCSLFCHHLDDAALNELIQLMRDHARVGFIINDLHRHPLAFYSIKQLTKWFGGSYLVQNDAPLSVLKSFTRNELMELMVQNGVDSFEIQWEWAFRYLVTGFNQAS